MSSLHRTIDGDVLVQHLTKDEQMIDQNLLVKHGRTGRTLVKEGPLRLTLIALDAGGGLPAHSTDGPVSIHVLNGGAVFTALNREYPLATGDVLVLAAGVEHSATSDGGVLLLLTVFHPPSAGTPLGDRNREDDVL